MVTKLFYNLLAVVFLVVVGLGFSVCASAELIKVDPNGEAIKASNILMIEKDMKKKPVVSFFAENNSLDVVRTIPSSVFQQNYEAYLIKFSDNSLNGLKGTRFTVYYSYVGVYGGKNVGARLIYTNIIPMSSFVASDPPRFVVSANMYSGYWYNAIRSAETSVQFFYEDTKELVDYKGDSYITFNSLNLGEFVKYENQEQGKNVYITNDSNVSEVDIPVSEFFGKAFMGNSSDFDDWLGSSNFRRNSVSFQVSGTDLKFKIGFYKDVVSKTVWNSLSSATLFNVKPDLPTKEVTNDSGKNINKEQVFSGQKLVYRVKQKVSTLGMDTLQRYTKFEIVDKLSDKVTYVSSKLVDKDNKEVDSGGTYKIDKKTNTLTYKASNNFLNKMPLNGEEYTLSITVTVNDDVRASDIIKNQASVTINNNTDNSNEVENKGADPKGAFTIYKVTDQLTGFENETLLPKYEEKAQVNVSYQITAEEPIKLTDGSIVAEKTSDFGKITTDEKGIATKKDIYAGKYRAVEVSAPIGIQIDPTPIIVDVKAEKDTATGKGNQKDPLQEVQLDIYKTFELEDGTFQESGGAKFGLYHAINHKIDDEHAILKDTLVSEIEISENGLGTYKGILIPNQQYYVKEIATKEGFQLAPEKFYFSYVPVSNDPVHKIELYENGYLDGELKKKYEIERSEKNDTEILADGKVNESVKKYYEDKGFSEESITGILGNSLNESESLIPIKNLLIKENSIIKSIVKEDGTKVDHYDLLKNGEIVTFEGLVFIGDNESLNALSIADTLSNGFSYQDSKVYDETGKEITDQTTIKNDGQKVTLAVNEEYGKELRRTSIRWVLSTVYKFSLDHNGQTFENQFQLLVNEKEILSNVVTLTPPMIEEKPKGSLPMTGEEKGYLMVAGVALILLIVALWYTGKSRAVEDECEQDESIE